LRQILFNLVATPSSSRKKAAWRSASGPNPRRKARCLPFRGERHGIGVPADKQAAIFAPFQQADTSMTRVYGGTASA